MILFDTVVLCIPYDFFIRTSIEIQEGFSSVLLVTVCLPEKSQNKEYYFEND